MNNTLDMREKSDFSRELSEEELDQVSGGSLTGQTREFLHGYADGYSINSYNLRHLNSGYTRGYLYGIVSYISDQFTG